MDILNDIIYQLSGEQPQIDIREDDTGAIINIHLTQNIPRVVGKQGKTIDAIRTIIRAIGYNGSHRIMVTLDENTER